MSFTDKTVYQLLPAVYRIRDAEQGEPLKALIEIIASQAQVMEQDIAQLYDNWFIETCEEWVIPYIGDLLGVKNLNSITGSSIVSQRAYVANTLRYRRRKGIAPVLEQLALDITGWRSHVVEFFQLLSTTQYMNHIRINRTVAPDLRKMDELDLLNTAFDSIAHTADLRHIESGRGRYNINHIGIYTWRLQYYPVKQSDAARVECPAGTPAPFNFLYTFDPLGNNCQLFNQPETETGITHISEEINVPGLLRRRALYDELEARRQAIVDGNTPAYIFFDDRLAIEGDPDSAKHPVFEIFPDGGDTPVPPEEILICNLENCCVPIDKKTYRQLQPDGTYKDVDMKITVVADPVSGRFIFTDPAAFKTAVVSYAYGFSGDLGAGPYNRQDSVSAFLEQPVTWQVGVFKTAPAGSLLMFKTIQEALAEWNNQTPGTIGIIMVMDSHSYPEDLEILIPEKSKLLIIAADCATREDPPGNLTYNAQDLAAAGLRPHIAGKITVRGKLNNLTATTGGELALNGLLMEGKLSVLKGNLGALNLAHCTLVPSAGGLEMGLNTTDSASNQWLKIALAKCICGPIDLHLSQPEGLQVEDCIIGLPDDVAIDASRTPVDLVRSTFFGPVTVKTINADNCIFNDTVKAIRRQTGCMRFCFVPGENPETPRRYRCQPELEIADQVSEVEKNGSITTIKRNEINADVRDWLVPSYTSVAYGHHAYSQLAATCPVQITDGADNGSEMGACCFLMQPQRKANLRIALDEYLPLGLEAGIIYVT